MMFERSDAFVALPGGVGTQAELVEMMTWPQLGRHAQPILLANLDGFLETLMYVLPHLRSAQVIRPKIEVVVLKAERGEDMLPRLRAAAARMPDSAKTMVPEVARRM